MKILRLGQVPDETLQGTCKKCNCKIECYPHETKLEEGDRPWDSSVRYVTCPTTGCNSRLYVFKKK